MTLREKAARAIYVSESEVGSSYREEKERNWDSGGSAPKFVWDQVYRQADAVIAAIDPDIRADERRKVFEALAEEWRSAAKGETSRGRIDAFHEFAFTMELRARKEAANE